MGFREVRFGTLPAVPHQVEIPELGPKLGVVGLHGEGASEERLRPLVSKRGLFQLGRVVDETEVVGSELARDPIRLLPLPLLRFTRRGAGQGRGEGRHRGLLSERDELRCPRARAPRATSRCRLPWRARETRRCGARRAIELRRLRRLLGATQPLPSLRRPRSQNPVSSTAEIAPVRGSLRTVYEDRGAEPTYVSRGRSGPRARSRAPRAGETRAMALGPRNEAQMAVGTQATRAKRQARRPTPRLPGGMRPTKRCIRKRGSPSTIENAGSTSESSRSSTASALVKSVASPAPDILYSNDELHGYAESSRTRQVRSRSRRGRVLRAAPRLD